MAKSINDNDLLEQIRTKMLEQYIEKAKIRGKTKEAKIKPLINKLKERKEAIEKIQMEQLGIEGHINSYNIETDFQYNKDQKEISQLYNECFHLINAIGEIVRGDEHPIELIVYSEDVNGDLKTIYIADESSIKFETPTSEKENSFSQYLKFSLINLQKENKGIAVSSAFNKYYKGFKETALNQKRTEKEYNTGHIQEAFDRHWQIFNPDKTPGSDGPFYPSDFSRARDRKIVHILVYYAKNSTSWAHGGDNKWRQVKGGSYGNINKQVSEFKTIENLIKNIINVWNDEKIITEEFNNLFKTIVKDELDEILDIEILKNCQNNKVLNSYVKSIEKQLKIVDMKI